MRRHRPASVLVLAVLHFVFGAIGIGLALLTILGTLFVYTLIRGLPAGRPGLSPMAQYQYLDVHLPYWKEIDIFYGLISLAISVLMIVAGIGLVAMWRWGRYLSVAYGAVSIFTQLIRLVYLFAFFLPAMMGYHDAMAAAGSETTATAAGAKVGLAIGLLVALVGFVYPIIVLIFMFLPSVAAAFNAPAAADEADAPYGKRGRNDDDYRPPPGYGDEPDDRFGPAPR